MKNIHDIVIDVLSKNKNYLSEEGKLLKAKIYTDVMTMDKDLITSLISNKDIKDEFFSDIDGILVFDKQKFAWLIESKEFLPDSYTKFSNKIGLTTEGEFISKKNDLVIDYPYKDCYLQGGQASEDQKKDEIFYHEVIGREHISRMLESKVLTNAKRYSNDGIEDEIEFNKDDNLLIKGNNLIGLSSLLSRYEGKIKLIYIDPPFNTGNDSFLYNDKFNRSTWLTFMKNRLELAYRLLSPDGNIFIHIDNNEYHYLKVLMDEIFKEENYVQDIIWAYGSASGGRSASAKPVNIHDFILNYAKSYSNRKAFKQYTPYSEKYLNDWFRYTDDDGRVYRRRMRGKDDEGNSIWEKQYLDESKGVPLTTVWDDIKQIYANPQAYKLENRSTSEIELEFGNSGQKPEKLLKRIIEMTTEEDDLVMDFFMGTGTTLATSLKLNRRFIGIEQIESQMDIAVNRLIEAINGKQSGISGDVNWEGGGSFVYCELLENGTELLEKIECSTEENILAIRDEIIEDHRIIPQITKEEFKEVQSEFEDLDFINKKKILSKLIDKNKLYVNLSDIDDENYSVTENDKKFTKSFYEVEGE